jgi:drug/metabolite transporter (DMT)-like permease
LTGSYRFWGMVLALLGTISFAFRPILVKLSYLASAISPTTLLFLRMSLALPFFLALAWWLRRSSPGLTPLSQRDWLALAGLGLVGYYLASLLDFMGLQYIPAGVGRLIIFVYPTIVVLLSFVFLRKRPSLRELLALVVTYLGIALVLSERLGETPEQRQFLFGAGLVFASAVAYAVYLVAGSALVKRVGSGRFTAYTMIASTVPAVLQFALLESPAALDLPASVWGYVLLIATVCTVLPVLFVAEALKRIGANHFALIGALGPVVTVGADSVLLEGPFGAVQLVGAALVISGVLLVSVKRS